VFFSCTSMSPLSAVALACCLVGVALAQGNDRTGHFSAQQAGNAFSKVNSLADTRTGLTHAGTRGIMANQGQLRGHTDVKDKNGGTQSMYAADMAGKGAMWADSQSMGGPGGKQASFTEARGFINKAGHVSGSVGAGANGAQPDSYAPAEESYAPEPAADSYAPEPAAESYAPEPAPAY